MVKLSAKHSDVPTLVPCLSGQKWSILHCCPANVGWRVLAYTGADFGWLESFEPHSTKRAADHCARSHSSWGTAISPVVLPPSPIAQFTDEGHLPNVTARTQRALELCLATFIRWDTQSLSLSLSIFSMAAHCSCDSGPERRDMSRTAMVPLLPLLRNYSTFSLPHHRVLPVGNMENLSHLQTELDLLHPSGAPSLP